MFGATVPSPESVPHIFLIWAMTTSIPRSKSTTPPTDQSLLFSQSSYCLYKLRLISAPNTDYSTLHTHRTGNSMPRHDRRSDSLDSNSEKDSDEADLGNLSKMVMHGGISIRVYFLLDCLFISEDKSRTIQLTQLSVSSLPVTDLTKTPQRSCLL